MMCDHPTTQAGKRSPSLAIKSRGYTYGSDVPEEIGYIYGEGPPAPGSTGGWGIPVTRADFPVGPRSVPLLPTRRVLPALVPPIARFPTAGTLNPPARRGTAPPTPVIRTVTPPITATRPVMINGTFVGRDEAIELVNGVWRRVSGGLATPIIKNTGVKSMDLGDLLGTLGTEYIKTKFGSTMGPQPAGFFPSVGGLTTTPALGIPFADLVPDAPECGRAQVWNPRANNGAGKWVNRSRRRRKRLATSSDIRDIGALKSVLSPAELKTWIAVHS